MKIGIDKENSGSTQRVGQKLRVLFRSGISTNLLSNHAMRFFHASGTSNSVLRCSLNSGYQTPMYCVDFSIVGHA